MADLIQVKRWIAAVNHARWPAIVALDGEHDAVTAEQNLNTHFQTHIRLAVYGTLAPGEPNYHIVAPYGGEWSDGTIRGDLGRVGWGAELNYPGFKPREDGSAISAKVLTSSALAAAWGPIDEFEGADYCRILVPVYDHDGKLKTVANIYAAVLMYANASSKE